MLPDISVGAVGAALIGALFSLVGLVIAKESKISEFRQAWIDALREALTKYLSNLNAIIDSKHIVFENEKEEFTQLQPLFASLNESYYQIALRINISEEIPYSLRCEMVKLGGLVYDNPLNYEVLEKSKREFLKISAELLKFEWTRVKDGEPVYKATRNILAFIFGISLFLLIKYIFWF